jgi:mRNA interferase MazF
MVKPGGYIPDRGDVIWIRLNPQAGHEQSGRRPAVVLSPGAYNSLTDLAILCPVTSRSKGYPFEVELPPEIPVSGVVLSDQVKSLDWKVRNAEFICTLPDDTVKEILSKLKTLVG